MFVVSNFFPLAVLPVNIRAFPAVADNVGLTEMYLNCSSKAVMQTGYALGFGKLQ